MNRDAQTLKAVLANKDNPTLSLGFKLYTGSVAALTIEHETTRREALFNVTGSDIPDLGHWETSSAARIFGSLLVDDLTSHESLRSDGGLVPILWDKGSVSDYVKRLSTLSRILVKMEVDAPYMVVAAVIRTRDIIQALSWLKDGQDDWPFWDDCMEKFIRQVNSDGHEWVW